MKKFYSLFLAALLACLSATATGNIVSTLSFTTPGKDAHTPKAPVVSRADDDDTSWTQWLDMGTVNVTYCGAIYQTINPELPILMRASTADANHVQYRIDGYLHSNIDPEASRPLVIDIIDGSLYVYPQELPKLKVNNADGTPFEGKLYVTDTAIYRDMVGLRDFYEFDTEKLNFDLMLTYYDDQGNALGNGVGIEEVRFNLPAWIKPPVIFTVGGDTDTATIPVEIGEAVDHYDYAIVKGGGYDADGNALYMSTGVIYYMPEDAANWQSIGKRKITDGFLPDVYGHEPIPYEVEVEKSLVTEGLYRVVNMYGDTHPYAAEIWEHTLDIPVYTYFHCEDPEACYISETSTGTIFDASGEVTISSVPEAYFVRHGYDMEAARKLYPDGFGKLTGGTYTFPSGSLIASAFVLLEANYGWLEVGKGNPLTLQIDPEASIDTVQEEISDEMPEYFNLQGMKIVNPETGNIYIIRKGGICKKVIK